METIADNQASTQSTLPQQAPSPEMQAAMAELAQIVADPAALEAKANQLGMGDKYKAVRDGVNAMQPRAQELMQKEQAIQKQFDELAQRAKGASSKMMAGLAALALAGGFLGYKMPKPDASTVKRTASTIGGLLAGGIVGGVFGRMLFGSKFQKEAKELTLQAQQVEVAKEQLAGEAQNLQQPFIMELAGKMAEAKKTQAAAPAAAPQASTPEAPSTPITPPAPSATTPSSSNFMDDQDVSDQSIKLGDQSIKLGDQSVAQSPATVSQQSFTAGLQQKGATTIKPRGEGFSDAAAKAQLAAAGAPKTL